MKETGPHTFGRDLADDLEELEREMKWTRAEALERVRAECSRLHDAAEEAEEEMEALAELSEKELAGVKRALREFKRVLVFWGGHETKDVYEHEKEHIIEAIRTAEEALERIESAGEITLGGLQESLADRWNTLRNRIEVVRLHLALASGSAESRLDYARDETRRQLREARKELGESPEPGHGSKVIENLRRNLEELGRDIGKEIFYFLDGASWRPGERSKGGDSDRDQ
jgi:hypothetical protein